MVSHINVTHIILYVKDQVESRNFYTEILRKSPDPDVPGMTEFSISPTCKLGLMPAENMAGIISNHLPHPSTGHGIPRCELYFYVEDLEIEYQNAIRSGAALISDIQERNWGDTACYFSDPDGHVIAFARKSGKK